MGCFPCMNSRSKDIRIDIDNGRTANSRHSPVSSDHVNGIDEGNGTKGSGVRSFTYRELATATMNFRDANFIGEGGFGPVFKGRLETGEMVAVKQLNHDGLQGNQEFIVEVLMLSLLHNVHLVTLIGYCTAGDQRLLVYEYMPKGSLENHLFDLEPDQEPLSWERRIKIAVGAARGLKYLHCKANPPVIYRDLKSANILLDNDFNPKLSDFGIAKLGPVGDKTHVSTRVVGTYGYCAPEYAMSGKLTLKSDIYSFGVVLMELITGRKAIDCSKNHEERKLVPWSRPFLKDHKKYGLLVDPLMGGRYPRRCLNYAIVVIAMCLNEEASLRPNISDILDALEYLACQTRKWSPDESSSNVEGRTTPQPSTARAEKASLARSDSKRGFSTI